MEVAQTHLARMPITIVGLFLRQQRIDDKLVQSERCFSLGDWQYHPIWFPLSFIVRGGLGGASEPDGFSALFRNRSERIIIGNVEAWPFSAWQEYVTEEGMHRPTFGYPSQDGLRTASCSPEFCPSFGQCSARKISRRLLTFVSPITNFVHHVSANIMLAPIKGDVI